MSAQTARRQTAQSFYREHAPHSMGEIDYIDFNYPVRIVKIPVGTRLWGFKDPRVSPLHRWNSFFTIPGIPIDILGVANVGNLKTNPKVLDKKLNVYEVMVEVRGALESVCKEGIDTWSVKDPNLSVPVEGGGWQYKVPEAFRYLRVV